MILLALLLLVPSLDGSSGVATHIRNGDIAYGDFRTREAINEYEKAYAIDPNEFATLTRLSRAWCDLGRLTLRRSDSSETYYRTALMYAQRLAELYPDSAQSWFMLALCHGSLTPFKSLSEKLAISQDVEKNLRHSLQIDSTYTMSYVLLGIYYRGVSRLSWWEKTIVNGILGKDIYGTLDDSYANLRHALDLEPGNVYARFEISNTLRSMGKNDEAVAMLRSVLDISPTNEREKQQRAEAQSRLDRMTRPQNE